MADPDLELRARAGVGGGGRGVLIFLPCWPFFLQSFLLLPRPRAPPLDPPLLIGQTKFIDFRIQ